MKAEHRKELETNTLADKMGHVMQNVKSGRRTTFVLYLVVAAALIVGSWFVYVYMSTSRIERSDQWLRLDDGGLKSLNDLSEKEPQSQAGKAARLQLAWLAYWERGVKRIGVAPVEGKAFLDLALKQYLDLVKDCENDPLYEPQAMLGVAVVEECMTAVDPLMLDKAEKSYKAVADKHVKSAEAQFAKKRLDQLKDKKQRAEIIALYDDLRRGLDIRAPQQFPNLPGFPKLPPGHPAIETPKKK